MSNFQISKFTLEQILKSEKKISDLQNELQSSMGFIFKSLDVSKKGLLTFTDFHSYILLKAYPFSLEDSRMIFSFLDKKSKGSISFSDFCSHFSEKDHPPSSPPKSGLLPSYSPITELKFYLLMREWLSSLKYRHDLANSPEVLRELDPSDTGFLSISAFARLTNGYSPETIAHCFGFRGKDRISKREFYEFLRRKPAFEMLTASFEMPTMTFHKNTTSLFLQKDLRDLEYNSYLDRSNDLKSARGNGKEEVLSKKLHFNYGGRKNEDFNRFWTERKLYTPRPGNGNGYTVEKSQYFNAGNQFFSASKEYSRSVYENNKKENENRNLFMRNVNLKGNKGNSERKYDVGHKLNDDIEKMMRIVEDIKKTSENEENVRTPEKNYEKKESLKEKNEVFEKIMSTKIVENLRKNSKIDKKVSLEEEKKSEKFQLENEKILEKPKENQEKPEENQEKPVENPANASEELQQQGSIHVDTFFRNKSPTEPTLNVIEPKYSNDLKSNYLKDGKTYNSIEVPENQSGSVKNLSENQTGNLLKVPDSLVTGRKNSSMIYESLIFALEEMYRQVKRKILVYQQPIIFLMISGSLNSQVGDETMAKFFQRCLLEIFDIQSFAIYSDNLIRTPYKDDIDYYERLKLESLLMDSFSIGAVAENLEKKGVFIQKLGENKDDNVIVYTINNPNEDNIMYSYFQLVEKYNFLGFKEHLTKFILLIDSIVLEKKAVELGFIVRELLNLIEYFIVNFKVLFLEHIKTVLSRSFDLEIIVNLATPRANSKKKQKTSRMSCFKDLLDQNSDPNELSLTVPNENCSFAIKFKDQGQNKNYFAIIYEQAMDIFQQLRSLVNSHSERLLFYEHFLESGNKNSLLLDFDKKGRLIFQSQPFNKVLREFLNLELEPKSFEQFKELEFTDIFNEKHEIYKTTMSCLQGNIRLKNLKEFLVNKMNFLGEREKTPLLLEKIGKKIRVITRGKSKNFKGFYILVQITEKNKEEEDDFDDQEEDQIEMKNELIQTWASEPKLVRKAKTKPLQTSAMVQRSLIMKSATMRNSILLDYVDEGLKSLMNFEKKESLPVGKTSFDSLGDGRSSEGLKIKKKKFVYQESTKPKADIFKIDSPLVDLEKFKDLESLDFNVLSLEINELFHLSWLLMNKFDFFAKYSVQPQNWLEFIWRMERKYNKRENPFHNFYHGLTVMHGCYCLVSLPSLHGLIPEFDQMALIFSGLCHDVSHTAHNNAYEMNSFSKLSIRYNDKSVLENHHLSTSFKILLMPQCSLFEKMERNDFLYLRKSMISNILATDMKEHFTILHNFELKMKENNFQKEKMMQSETDKLSVYGMLIHCCDFFGNIKPFDVSREWSKRVNKEFSQQYLDEGKLGLPQTPYYKDLDHLDILIRNEINFTKVIIQPLWNVLNQFLQNEVDVCINNSVSNLISWEKFLEEADKQVRVNDKANWIEPIKEEEKQEKTDRTQENEPNDAEALVGRNLNDLSSDDDEEENSEI